MDEVNFDGLVGPTHHYGGLSFGNLASMQHAKQTSNPKEAALQGLRKMKLLMDLGMTQAVIPPQERPSLLHLRLIGFTGKDHEVIERAAKQTPHLFYAFSSSSFMWTANAATVSPSLDTPDQKLHISIANLQTDLHRSIESEATYTLFKTLFPKAIVHPPLPKGGKFGDEGAANHTRLETGEQIFVYGSSAFKDVHSHFPIRQSLEASMSIARRHGVKKAIFLQQNREVIDQGVFHNDVIATGHGKLYLYHEKAYVDDTELAYLNPFKVSESMLPLKKAISSYLFNSQIITLPNQEVALIAPEECRTLNLDWLPIKKRYFIDLKQSMQNGGGPACLRLRILMTKKEQQQTHRPIFLTPVLYEALVKWVSTHYRDRLTLEDLADPLLLRESQEALKELSKLLKLNKLYRF